MEGLISVSGCKVILRVGRRCICQEFRAPVPCILSYIVEGHYIRLVPQKTNAAASHITQVFSWLHSAQKSDDSEVFQLTSWFSEPLLFQ